MAKLLENGDMVVSQKEYKWLSDRANLLECLIAEGVEEWEWYIDATNNWAALYGDTK